MALAGVGSGVAFTLGLTRLQMALSGGWARRRARRSW